MPKVNMDNMIEMVRQNFQRISEENAIFRTKTTLNFENFIRRIEDPVLRQTWNCSCCKAFFNRYGGLVFIDKDDGYKIKSALFSGLEYDDTVVEGGLEAFRLFVENRPSIKSRFLHETGTVEIKHDHSHNHFSLTYQGETPKLKHTTTLEHFKALHLILTEHKSADTHAHLGKLIGEFKTNSSHYQWIGKVRMVREIFAEWADAPLDTNMTNFIWHTLGQDQYRAEYLLHYRGSVLGTAMAALHDGRSVSSVMSLFGEMTDPFKYRHQDPDKVSETQIKAQGKELLESGYLPSLNVEYCSADDLEGHPTISVIWKSPIKEKEEVAEEQGGSQVENLLGKLLTEDRKKIDVDPIKTAARISIYHEKFIRDILPMAKSISIPTYVHRCTPVWFIKQSDQESLPVFKSTDGPVRYSAVLWQKPYSSEVLGIDKNREAAVVVHHTNSQGQVWLGIIPKATPDERPMPDQLPLVIDAMVSDIYPHRHTVTKLASLGKAPCPENPLYGVFMSTVTPESKLLVEVDDGETISTYEIFGG